MKLWYTMEKISEFLDHILKPVMQESWSYIKNSGDFLKKVKHLGPIPDGLSWLQQMW